MPNLLQLLYRIPELVATQENLDDESLVLVQVKIEACGYLRTLRCRLHVLSISNPMSVFKIAQQLTNRYRTYRLARVRWEG